MQHQAELGWLDGYQVVWNPAVKKGYSGTAVFSRLPFKSHALGMNLPGHDNEGRVITLEFADFFLVNVYTPNAQEELKRLPYRMQWDEDFRLYLGGLREKEARHRLRRLQRGASGDRHRPPEREPAESRLQR